MEPWNPLGTVSSGTLRPEDIAESLFHFIDGLQVCGSPSGAAPWGDCLETRNRWWDRFHPIADALFPNDDGSMVEDREILANCIEEMEELLHEICPPYMYFGAREGDGADIGFWPAHDSLSELPKYDDYPDELPGDDFIVVNDHGNLSVYAADGSLIWDCV